jgi:hypothetical protein
MELLAIIILVYLIYFLPEQIAEKKKLRRKRDGVPEIGTPYHTDKLMKWAKENPAKYQKYKHTSYYF